MALISSFWCLYYYGFTLFPNFCIADFEQTKFMLILLFIKWCTLLQIMNKNLITQAFSKQTTGTVDTDVFNVES